MSESDDTATPTSALQSTDHLYDALSDTKTRLALAYLDAVDEAVTLEELSEAIAPHLGDGQAATGPGTESIRIELHHWHLPKLDDVGLVAYDPADRTVRALDHPVWSTTSELPGFDVF